MNSTNIQAVKVWVNICGNYCSFNEMSFNVVYDITNNIQLGDDSLEVLENWKFSDYHDFQERDGYLINDTYYVKWD